MSKSWFVKARKDWTKKGFPRNFDKNLMRFGFGKGELPKIKRAILELPISKLEFDSLKYMKTLIRLYKRLI